MIQINLHKYDMVRSLAAYLLCKGDMLEGIDVKREQQEEKSDGKKEISLY